MRLKQAQLADAFGGNPAGGEIGDAAAGKLQPDVSDIDFRRQNRNARRANFVRHFADQRKHNVDIVNHQIEHHVHVETARAEFAHAVDFEKQGPGDGRFQRQNGGVKALQMADLQDRSCTDSAARSACRASIEIGGDRFFDQHIQAELHQPASDFGVRGGGRRDHGGVGIFGQFFKRRKDSAIGGCRAGGIDLEDTRKFSFRRFPDDADVITGRRIRLR